MHWDRQGDDSAGGERWFELAPITDLDDTAICYIGWYTHHAQRHSDLPRLSDEQVEAMERSS